jgi:hypothetical protein
MLRTDYITHIGNGSWWRAELDFQLGGANIPSTFTANGMYQDHSGSGGLNPLPYDTFPLSGYLTVMLQEGYNGTWAPAIGELTRRAAWTHLLMQSPWGEVPTGGRSSQHTWNEAVSALAYEVNAVRYAAAGDAGAACMFQRAARLSHESVRRWQVPGEGRFQIVKNHYDPSLRYGYEGYSYLSQYNLLPAAMLAAAHHYADAADAIPECATFADAGGFAFELPEHHLVIANAGGLYAQVETAADPHYESSGLLRVHANTCGAAPAGACAAVGALAALSASPAQELGGAAPGPWWETAAGGAASLANASYADIEGVVVTPGWVAQAGQVEFAVEYVLASGVVVRQAYNLSAASAAAPTLTLTSSVSQLGAGASPFTKFGLQLCVWQPLLRAAPGAATLRLTPLCALHHPAPQTTHCKNAGPSFSLTGAATPPGASPTPCRSLSRRPQPWAAAAWWGCACCPRAGQPRSRRPAPQTPCPRATASLAWRAQRLSLGRSSPP